MFSEDIVPNNATSAVITKKESGLVLTGLEIDPRELYFGAMVIGEDPMTKTATVKNIGRRTLRINSVVLETESDQFQMIEAHPNLLKSGESFTITATYAGDQPTLVTGVIYIDTNEDRDPYRILLSGRVLASLYIQEQFDDFSAKLEQESWARAAGDEAEAGQRLLLQASLRDEIDAKILVERIARVTAVQAEATSRELLAVVVYDNHAELLEEKTVRATADDAMAQRISTLEASTGDGLSETQVRGWITEEAVARANADEAEATARQELGATFETAINDANARIDSEQTARADADSALAQTQVELSASLEAAIENIGGMASAIESLSTTVEEIDGVLTSQASQINTITASAYATGNLLPNSELINLTGWALGHNNTTPAGVLEGYNSAWHSGEGGLTVAQLSASDGNLATYTEVYWFPDYSAVEGGKRYQYAFDFGAHRCHAEVYIAWYTSADVYISATNSGAGSPATAKIASGEKSGGKSINDFKRCYGFANAPSNAARARLVIRKYNTDPGQATSYLFCQRPMLARARVGQTEPDPYMSGVPIKNISASIQETRTVAVNTKGEVDALWRMNIVTDAGGYKMRGIQLGSTGGITAFDASVDWFRVSLPNGTGTTQVFTVGSRADGGYGVTINGALMLNGSLTIRDAAGNVILHSGGSVQSQIAPYEWGATAGATIGSNLFGQFNGSNIGTYMANAAISYLQLAGGAVSVSNGAAFSGSDFGFGTVLADIYLSIPASGYLSFTGNLELTKRGELNTTTQKWFQGAGVTVQLYKNGTQIYLSNFGANFYNGAYVGNTEDATLGGIGNGQCAICGGVQVSAAPGDQFRLRLTGSVSLRNHSAQQSYTIGTVSGFINFVGSYR